MCATPPIVLCQFFGNFTGVCVMESCLDIIFTTLQYELNHCSGVLQSNFRGGAMAWWLTSRTPDPEVGGSSPTRVAVLCP